MAGTQQATTPPPPPTIHEAELAPGPSGAVIRGSQIDFAAAVNRRQAQLNVVVCGDDEDANRSQAYAIEFAVGLPSRPQPPHKKTAGPHALPHFQQRDRSQTGHTFYETARRKAGKKP
jgi:hypothetical protein